MNAFQFPPGVTAVSLRIDGSETFDLDVDLANLAAGQDVSLVIRRADGRVAERRREAGMLRRFQCIVGGIMLGVGGILCGVTHFAIDRRAVEPISAPATTATATPTCPRALTR